MNSVILKGIAPASSQIDDREILILEVTYNDEKFNWAIKKNKNYTGTLDNFVGLKEQTVLQDVANKLQEWNNLDPKTREITDPLSQVTITVSISKDEIVRPTLKEVPQKVTRFQAKSVMYAQGILSAAQALVETANDPMLNLVWEEALHFERDSPTLAAMAGALGITSEQLDDLFIAAEQVSV